MKVIIACGGSGGHLFPGLAVAETLLARRHDVRLLVSEKAVDRMILDSWRNCDDGFRFGAQSLPAVGFDRSCQWIRSCCRFGKAIRECVELCHRFKPDAVLGMGGPTTAPTIVAARWGSGDGIPALIHESNAVPGNANRWMGRFVDHVAVGLSDCARFFGRRPVNVTGTPIRSALRRGLVPDARQQLGLEPDRLTVLVMGGSQGAHPINEAIACAMPWLEDWTGAVQFVHLSGEADQLFARETYEKNGFLAKVMSFSSEMELVYSAADLVVARAGAATLTELTAFALPAILIPYPYAASNHQWHNARVFEQAGAAQVIEQFQVGGLDAVWGDRLAGAIAELLDDEPRRQRMAAAARRLSVPDAAERITDLLELYGS